MVQYRSVGEWRNGRRAGLKIQFWQQSVGSTPSSPTTLSVVKGTLSVPPSKKELKGSFFRAAMNDLCHK